MLTKGFIGQPTKQESLKIRTKTNKVRILTTVSLPHLCYIQKSSDTHVVACSALNSTIFQQAHTIACDFSRQLTMNTRESHVTPQSVSTLHYGRFK